MSYKTERFSIANLTALGNLNSIQRIQGER